MKKLIISAIAALSLSTTAFAQGSAVDLKGTVQLVRTELANGVEKTVLVAPDVVVPGDRLLFATRYTNTSTQRVDNFVVTNPLPAAVSLAPESSADQLVSVDGGKVFGPLAKLTVADGEGGSRPAQVGDVTHVRWILPTLAPGATGTVSYPAIVR